jgi:hypothetical protein
VVPQGFPGRGRRSSQLARVLAFVGALSAEKSNLSNRES